jgi:hypothetical protein
MALIMVVGTASVLAIITSVIAVQSISNLRQAGTERAFERSLHVADAGVDHMLFRIRQQKQASQTDLTTGEVLPASPFASVQAERQWVLDKAAAASAVPGRLVTTREGDWIAMRPVGAPLIYSVGYVPSYAAATAPSDASGKIRVLRAEYDFAPFSPSTAILTDDDLQIGGNVIVDGSGPNAHANGDVTVIGGSVEVGGFVSSSGGFTGSPNVGDPANTGGGRPRMEVPDIDPRANYAMSEYDLCPDGTVRTGPSYDAGPEPVPPEPVPPATWVPCSGSILADNTDFRNWEKQGDDASQGAQWTYRGNGPGQYDGVYYIYLGSAGIPGSPGSDLDPWEVTIFAEASGSGPDEPDCPHTGGDIDISGGPTMVFNDKGEGLGFVAGRDLEISGTPGSGFNFTGVHAAHEQFDVRGNARMEGAVLGNDSCDTAGSPVGESAVSGSVRITFDGASVPLGSNIRTTLWLEI